MPDMNIDRPSTPVGSPTTILGSPRTVTGSLGTVMGDDEHENQQKCPKPETAAQASFQIRSNRAEKSNDEGLDEFEEDNPAVFRAPKLIPLVPSRAHGVKPVNYPRDARGIYKYDKAEMALTKSEASQPGEGQKLLKNIGGRQASLGPHGNEPQHAP